MSRPKPTAIDALLRQERKHQQSAHWWRSFATTEASKAMVAFHESAANLARQMIINRQKIRNHKPEPND